MEQISWHKRIPFFQNIYLLRSVFLAYFVVILLTSIIIITIFIADGDMAKLGEVTVPFLLLYLFLFLLFLLGTWIATGSKYALKYTIGPKGIRIEGTRDKGKDIRELAIAAGIMTANPGLTGAGLLVQDDTITIAWKEIKNIEWDEDRRRLIIECSFWKQMALHYPESIADEISKIVHKHWN